MYCCPCRGFSRRSGIRTIPFASASGFKNLKDASIRMPEHSASIAQMLNVDHAKHIQENRHYLTAILKSVLLCCRWHGIAFRGHHEDLTNTNANPGNTILAVLGNCVRI